MSIETPIDAYFSIPKAFCPKASPDGEWVACNWNTTGRFELHAIHLESGERRQLTEGDLPLHPEEATYRWAAESDAILYQVARDGATDIYRAALDGHRDRLFTVDDSVLLWAVNPATGTIYYRVEDDTLRWRNPTTGESGDFPHFPGLSLQIPATCAVSPDGEWVAYTSLPPEANEADTTTYESGLTTYIARADGSDPKRVAVSDHGRRLTPVQWHPNGDRLLVERDDGHWRDGRTCGIYDRRDETVEWVADAGAVAFLNDGTQILAGAPPRSATEVYDVEGNKTAIPCEGLFHLCNGSEAVVGDTGFVLQRSTEDRPYEVLHHDVSTGETTVLFGAGYDDRTIGPETFVEPTEIQYPLSDGETAGGLLYRPPNGRDTSTPAVVICYGQRSQWSHKFRPHVQLLVHLGYSVLFANCPVDGWSQAEHEVFAAAGRWLAQQDGIDAQRVTAYGHSHGGYNVYMQAVQYPEVWDAFVADTGCVDLLNATAVGNLRRQLGDPTDNATAYEQLSPINYTDGTVGSPLLMIHGEDDGCADQPRVFEDALHDKGWTNGVEYEYIELAGVGHAPKSRDTQIQQWRAIINFLDRRLLS
jgi:dipeptidyl aminopeptidase/acylaminoacyl peptidase